MEVPYLDDDQIFHTADSFLKAHHTSLKVPVPIEDIIEIKLGVTIFPIRDLESGCQIDGSLSKDFNTILIDEHTFENIVPRARFTLAHEIGHYILHQDLFRKSGGFRTESDFIAFQNALQDREYKRLEIQAYRFAEEVLFPRSVLKSVITQEVESLGGSSGLIVSDLERIISTVAKSFEVSGRASFNKIKRDYPSLIEIAQSNIPF